MAPKKMYNNHPQASAAAETTEDPATHSQIPFRNSLSHLHPSSPMEEMKSSQGSRKRKQFQSPESMKPCNHRITESPTQLVPQSILKKPKTIQGGASSDLSIKDLRARRVFSPAARDGSDLVSGSGMEMRASPKGEKEKSPNCENVGIGKSKKKMKNEGENRRNGFISSTTMVRKSVSRGKVYISPSSFSYRRMLPFLNDMVKEEEPSTKTGIVDTDIEAKDSINGGSDCKLGEPAHTSEDFNGISPPENGLIQNSEILPELKAQGLCHSGKGKPQNVAKVGLLNGERRIFDSGVTEVDVKIEDHMQATPPDSNILSKVDIQSTDVKGQSSFLGCLPNGTKSTNHVPGPTQRNNTYSITKQVLSPCSYRSKIYASSSSFSYRRLLPFLMDVEKGSANNDPSPEYQRQIDSSSNAELFNPSDSKCGFQENQLERCMEISVQPMVNISPLQSLKQVESSQNSEIYISPDSKSKDCGFQEYQQEKCVELNVQPSTNGSFPQCQEQVESIESSELIVSLDSENEARGFKGNQLDEFMEIDVQPGVDDTSPQCLKPIESSQISESFVSPDSKDKACVFQDNQEEKSMALHVQPIVNVPFPQCQKQVESIQRSDLIVSLDGENETCGSQGNQLEKCMELNVQAGSNDTYPQCLKPIESSQISESSESKAKACAFQENQQEKTMALTVQPSVDVPSLQCQKLVGSSQSFELYVQLDIENEAHGFDKDQLGNCTKLNAQDSISTPSNDGPHGVCELNTECFVELDAQITGQEMATPQRHAQLNETRKLEGEIHDSESCDAETNQLGEMPISRSMILPGESGNQPVDILSNCTAELVHNEGKVDKTKSVLLIQGSLESGEFDNTGSECPIKGILKRNPRGCRGLCSCLNCSSFRLHAERAFEFSRNQMLDAEEVVLMLINELGELRDSLEKSVTDGSDLLDVPLKQLQVRETCKKSLAVEQVAKQRISQMSDDLNAHCRTAPLQR